MVSRVTSPTPRAWASVSHRLRLVAEHVHVAALDAGGQVPGIAGHNRSLQTPGQASRGRLPGVPSLDERVISQHSRKRRGSQEALGPHEKDEGSRWLRFLDAHEPGVRRPVTAVGRIRIQNGRSSALAHGYRPSWLSRPISVSSSTTSARPLTNTLHPDCVRSS
jgi:hypothetical protein